MLIHAQTTSTYSTFVIGPSRVQAGSGPGPAGLGGQGAAEVEGNMFFNPSLGGLGLHVEGF